MCFSKCIFLFIYCFILNHCLCPKWLLMSLPSAWMNPFLSKNDSFYKIIENLGQTCTKHLLIIILYRTPEQEWWKQLGIVFFFFLNLFCSLIIQIKTCNSNSPYSYEHFATNSEILKYFIDSSVLMYACIWFIHYCVIFKEFYIDSLMQTAVYLQRYNKNIKHWLNFIEIHAERTFE